MGRERVERGRGAGEPLVEFVVPEDKNRLQVPRATRRPPERGSRVPMGDHHPGAGVGIEVLDGVGLELRVRHDDGRADLERAEQRSHEPWPVRKGDYDALLGLDAALGEYVAEPIRQRLDLPVGERLRVGEHGRPLALPFTHAGVEEVVGDVELLGRLEAHRDRYRRWTAGGQPARPGRYSPPMAVLDLAHPTDPESTRLNSSHPVISYAGFCFKKKKKLSGDAMNPTSRAPS